MRLLVRSPHPPLTSLINYWARTGRVPMAPRHGPTHPRRAVFVQLHHLVERRYADLGERVGVSPQLF